jgi:hypothetical protein
MTYQKLLIWGLKVFYLTYKGFELEILDMLTITKCMIWEFLNSMYKYLIEWLGMYMWTYVL